MNRRFCRLLAYCVMLVFTALVFQFSGCSNRAVQTVSKVKKGVKHLVMWKFKSSNEDYMIYDWVKTWNKEHPDIQVDLEIIPYNDYLTSKLPTAFATNSAPDIYMISAGSFLRYANAGCMMPLDKYISSSLKRDFYEPSLKAATYKGKIVGIPIEVEPVALFYNKKVFKQKKLTPPKNWAELQRDARILNSKDMSGIYLPIQPDDYQNFIFYTFLMQSGGGVINVSSRKSQFGVSAERALTLWRELSKYNYNFETSIQSPSDINPLASGKAAIQICGYWAVNMLKKYYPKFDYGITKVPYPEDGRNTSVYGGWYQVVNPGSKNAEEAAKFALWMWGEDTVRPMEWCTEASTKFPARRSVVARYPKLFSFMDSRIFKEDILPNAVPEPRYPVEIANTVSRAIQDAMFTDRDINAIVRESDKTINNYLRLNKSMF